MQASIQGDFVRVSGKDRDTLQSVIQLLRNTQISASTRNSPTTGPTEAARRIESLMLVWPGRLARSVVGEPEETPARALALVCHPHPLFGGTMHTKRFIAWRGIALPGAAVLRFNFRGVGMLSEHDHGVAKTDDARHRSTGYAPASPGLPYVLAGFSFGSRVILGLAAPTGDVRCSLRLASCRARRSGVSRILPLVQDFIQSTRDEPRLSPKWRRYSSESPSPKQLVWIEAQDHFFQGGLDQLEAR